MNPSALSLSERFGTPLYVYSMKTLLSRYRGLKKIFNRKNTLVCYALKANSNRSLCGALAREGAGADIVSGGELLRALGAGYKASRIVFSGVGKTADEMELALRRGILTFNLESTEEMFLLEKIARRLKRPAPVSIRLNPGISARTHPHIATGRAEDKFGVDKTEALAMYQYAERSRWLSVKGIQCHIGSQIAQAKPYELAAREVAGLMEKLAALDIKIELADFGGGMGIDYGDGSGLDVKCLAEFFNRLLKPWPQVRLLIEPGRYLVADAGVLLTRVLYRKQNGRRRFLVVDAAMNDLARPALYGAHHPIRAVGRYGRLEKVDVVGPICESGDFLARQRKLPICRPGDILAVLKTGAYGFSMSSQYNSRPRAAEVLIEDGRARLIRARESFSDLVRLER